MDGSHDVDAAHKHSARHRSELENSTKCGCFYCLETFKLPDISEPEWIDDDTTLLCPFCGIDSVIGDASGHPLDSSFLQLMRARWFG